MRNGFSDLMGWLFAFAALMVVVCAVGFIVSAWEGDRDMVRSWALVASWPVTFIAGALAWGVQE